METGIAKSLIGKLSASNVGGVRFFPTGTRYEKAGELEESFIQFRSFFNLHSSRWVWREEGSSDGDGLKMEKTLYQEGEKGRGRREGKKTFSGMSLSEQAEGIVS